VNTLEFFTRVLPASGIYVLAVQRPGYDGPSHHPTTSLDTLAKWAQQGDKPKHVVYHACSSFKEEIKGRGMRHATNAASVRSQWADIDVGESKPYRTKKDAALAVLKFARALTIPDPLIVDSGGGLHCYWCFDQDVAAQDALPYMKAFARAMRHHGLQADYKCSVDLSRVLRPVGTHWRKRGDKEVRMVRDGPVFDPAVLHAAVRPFLQADTAAPVTDADDEWSTGPKSYPPSSAEEIIKFCPSLKTIADKKGDVPEPAWRNMLGLVKHCTEGRELAHAWSVGYANYTQAETDDKYDKWSAGPTTCEQFALTCDECEGCQYRERHARYSPIHLGYTQVAPSANLPPPKPAPVITAPSPILITHDRKTPGNIPFWPKGYRWNGDELEKFTPPEDPADPPTWVPILSTLVYPYMRYPNEEREMMLRCCALINAKQSKWKTFDIPTRVLSDNRALAQELSAHEVFIVGEKHGVAARQFFKDIISNMQDIGLETEAFNAFGWYNGSFVLGSSIISTRGIDPVFLGERVPEDLNVDFGERGTATEWAELIDTVYNRTGAEPYQFLICAGFAAPLIHLAGSNLWHGIPIALTGEGGVGKTTTAMVACSMYGNPGRFVLSTNEDGATMNALLTRVGLMRHLPIVLDEMTGRKVEDVQGMLYALSNGRPKERNKANGTLISGSLTWDTFSIITGNVNITNMMATLDQHRSEATQLRCFEITVDNAFNTQLFRNINAKDMIERRILGENYGAAGRLYLRFVAKNIDKVSRMLTKTRAKLQPHGREETRERFYTDTVAMVVVAGKIAKKLGLIDFDIATIEAWALNHIRTLRTARGAASKTAEDFLEEFLGSLLGRMVVTETIPEGHGGTGPTFEVDPRDLRYPPAARIGRADKKFYVTSAYFTEWCRKNNLVPKTMHDKWVASGVILPLKVENERIRLFRGTSLPSTRVRCISLDYNKLMHTGNDAVRLKLVK
jgi:hypothetical protein